MGSQSLARFQRTCRGMGRASRQSVHVLSPDQLGPICLYLDSWPRHCGSLVEDDPGWLAHSRPIAIQELAATRYVVLRTVLFAGAWLQCFHSVFDADGTRADQRHKRGRLGRARRIPIAGCNSVPDGPDRTCDRGTEHIGPSY